MQHPSFSRREAMARLMSGTAAMGAITILPAQLRAMGGGGTRIGHGSLTIEFDASMRSRVLHDGKALTAQGAGQAVRLADGTTIDRFLLLDHDLKAATGPHGAGRRHMLRSTSGGRLEQRIKVTFPDRYPALAIVEITYRNTGPTPLAIAGWRSMTHDLLPHPGGAWTFSGASHADRRDWVQRVKPGFDQRNFMGMNASDYGGGTPVAVVWRRDAGLAIGHLETVPRLVALPVFARPDGTRLGMSGDEATTLDPGATLTLPTTFLMAHEGDHFRPLDAYRRLMAERGIAAPAALPPATYAPVWCAWGYERNFNVDQITATLPKAKSMGLDWAVLDDGWQRAEGDWRLDPVKFPRGDADMTAFVTRIRAAGMRPRLWLAPLAVDPGTPLLRDHGDMLLLDRTGAPQKVTWWDAFTMCPAYQPVIDYHRAIVRKIIGEWGYEGLKLDGQHLNGVAPCHNPAHNHARPEESFEKLQDFWKALYDEARGINPEAVVELCPCGDSFAFHNLPATNNTPASDPLTSWQVRLKGKTFKALMGPQAPYSGDHVELSDNRDDWASTYGIGAIPSTKFTWPRDTDRPIDKLPPGGFVLTAAKEATWRKWISLYRDNMLSKGDYLGGLYDIGFDRPEAHAIAKDGALHYAFFADKWEGAVELRGLEDRRYVLTDGFTGMALGTATGTKAAVRVPFERFLLITATPVGGKAS